mgnify:CR=1 FL=1
MASISAGDLRERIGVLDLRFQAESDQYQWAESQRLWADAELDTRSNLRGDRRQGRDLYRAAESGSLLASGIFLARSALLPHGDPAP